MAPANKTKIPVGTVLAAKYRVTREIGRGGMAAVYEAENLNIGKRVAIKVLAQELTSSRIVVERFLREARAAAAIRSPYICDVYDSGTLEDGRPFLVLELLEGESLYERMTKVRHLDIETTVAVMSQTCRGLTKAHAAQIVHRDLKPENIFLTKDEEGHLLSKILDFGLAKFYAPMSAGGGKQARLTREGAVFGTPAYMSPEQVRGQGAVDHRADLWALGCITYECLTGKTVWQTEQGVAMTFAQIANAPLPRPAVLRPDLPQAFTSWFDRALDRNIDQRFQSAKEFASELATAFKQGQPSFASLPGTPPPRRSRDAMDSEATLVLRESGRSSQLRGAPGTPERRVPPDAPTAPPPAPPQYRASPPPRSPPPPAPGAQHQGSGGSVSSFAPLLPSVPAPPMGMAPGPPQGGPRGGPGSAGGVAAPPRLHDDPPELPSALRPGRSSRRALRVVAGLLAVGLLVAGGYAGWTQLEGPAGAGADAGAGDASSDAAVAALDAGPSRDAGTVAPPPPAAGPPWMATVRDGQAALAADDPKAAARLFKEAADKGGSVVARTLLEHVNAALTGGQAACRLTGLARPRTSDLALAPPTRATPAGRPSVAAGPHGAVVAWTEARDGAEHVFTVALDDAFRDLADPFDVTPDGAAVTRPELLAAGDKVALAYWDPKSNDPGARVRLLDGDGRDAGAAVTAGPAHGGTSWASITRAPDAGFFLAWTDEGDANSEDLYLRRLGPALELQGESVRATDLVSAAPGHARARVPAIAADAGSVHLAFRLEREPQHLVEHLRVPLADAGKGLDRLPHPSRTDRSIGELALVNADRGKADAPTLACGAGACFVMWQGEGGAGAWGAYVESAKAQPLWRKKISLRGTHPAVAVSAEGRAQAVWFEGGRVLTAALGRDGPGPVSRVARVAGDQPTPAIAPGSKPGEWYLAWLDSEQGHLEAYAARVLCR